MRRSAPMRAPRRYDSARAACVAPRASLGRLRSLIQAPVAPAFNRSPHSSSPAISDTASAPALQVDIMCGPSSPEVSDSVMEEPGAEMPLLGSNGIWISTITRSCCLFRTVIQRWLRRPSATPCSERRPDCGVHFGPCWAVRWFAWPRGSKPFRRYRLPMPWTLPAVTVTQPSTLTQEGETMRGRLAVAIVAALVTLPPVNSPGVSEAAKPCTVADLNGTYVFTATGFGTPRAGPV